METKSIALSSVMAVAVVGILFYLGLQYSEQRTLIINGSGSSNFTDTTTCTNMANTYRIVVNSTDGNCFIRALANGTNIQMAINGTHIIISSNTTGESTVCTNIGTYGSGVYASGNCDFKKILGGTGITVTSNSTNVIVTNSLPDNTVCASVGTGAQVYKDGECNFRTIKGSADISVVQGTNDITVDFNGTDNNFCTSTGTGEAICESANNINSLIATSPLTVSDTTGDLTIACSTCLVTPNGDKFIQLAQQTLSGSSSIINQISGTATFTSLNNVNSGDSEHITASGASVGSVINAMTLPLKKQSSPTGTATIAVLDSSNNVVYTFGTLDVSTLTTTMARYNFINTDADYTIASGDYLGIKYSGGTAVNTVDVGRTTNNQYDGSNSVHSVFSAGAWADGTTDLGNSSANQMWKVDHFLTSKTFTAKKHVFFSVIGVTATSTLQAGIVFNSDTPATHYAFNPTTGTSQSSCRPIGDGNYVSGDRFYLNGFISNVSADRKLVIGGLVTGADSSSATAPAITNYACKWDNTSAQITSMGLIQTGNSGTFTTNSILTVWGYD